VWRFRRRLYVVVGFFFGGLPIGPSHNYMND
jgi:hypothetical protein